MGASVTRYAVLDPTGRPARELAGFAPGGGSPAGGSGSGAGNGQPLIHFAAKGLSGPTPLGVLPPTNTPHELSPAVRTWYNFAGETTAVLQGRVDTSTDVAGTLLLCLWRNNGIWQYLGTDANGVFGPTMPLDVQGDLIGTPVTLGADVLAAGDVLLGLFTSVGAANASPPGSPPGSTGGTGTTPIGSTASSKGVLVGFSVNPAEAGRQPDYPTTINEMVGGGGILVAENATEAHLLPSVAHSPVLSNADINFDFSILQYALSTAQSKGIAAKIYLFEGANGSGTSGASPAWYNAECTSLSTTTNVMYAIIDGALGWIATNFPGVVVEINIANEIYNSGGGRNTNPWQHWIGNTWVRLAMLRGESILPGMRWQINNDHTEDDGNTGLRNAITAFWTDILQNTTLRNLSNGNEMHVTASDGSSIGGITADLVGIFGTGVAWAAWSLSLWNMGVSTGITEIDVSDYTNDGPAPNNPATTIPLRDAAVADRFMRVALAALTLPPGALTTFIPWQLPDLNTWLKAFLTARQDRQAFRPCPLGTVGGDNYARKVCPDGTNLFDRLRALFTSLPNLGSGSAAGTGSSGTGGATGGGTPAPSTGGTGTGVVGNIAPPGVGSVVDTGIMTPASSPAIPTTPVGANGVSFKLGGPLSASATLINSSSGTVVAAWAASSPQPSGLAFEFPAGQQCDPAVGLDIEFAAAPVLNNGHLFIQWRGMLGTGWSVAQANAQSLKMFAPKDNEGNDHIVMGYGNSSSGNVAIPGFGFGVGLQGPTTQNLPPWSITPFAAIDEFQAGVYNTFGVAIYPNSAGGVADGRVVLSINGVVTEDSGNTLEIFSYSGGVPKWLHLDLYIARAVYSGTETGTLFYYMDQLLVQA